MDAEEKVAVAVAANVWVVLWRVDSGEDADGHGQEPLDIEGLFHPEVALRAWVLTMMTMVWCFHEPRTCRWT